MSSWLPRSRNSAQPRLHLLQEACPDHIPSLHSLFLPQSPRPSLRFLLSNSLLGVSTSCCSESSGAQRPRVLSLAGQSPSMLYL